MIIHLVSSPISSFSVKTQPHLLSTGHRYMWLPWCVLCIPSGHLLLSGTFLFIPQSPPIPSDHVQGKLVCPPGVREVFAQVRVVYVLRVTHLSDPPKLALGTHWKIIAAHGLIYVCLIPGAILRHGHYCQVVTHQNIILTHGRSYARNGNVIDVS